MKPEEYDEFIFDPTAFYLTKYLPRVLGVFDGMEELPYLPGLHYFRLVGGMRAFAKPRVRAALEKIMKAAERSSDLQLAYRLHKPHDGAGIPDLAHQHVGRSLRPDRRLLPRRHRHDEGSLSQ